MIFNFNGQTIRIDKEDYPLLVENIHDVSIKDGGLYIGDRAFHRLMIGEPTNKGIRQNIRFKNNDKLDLRRSNLLIGTKQDRWKKRLTELDTVSKL